MSYPLRARTEQIKAVTEQITFLRCFAWPVFARSPPFRQAVRRLCGLSCLLRPSVLSCAFLCIPCRAACAVLCAFLCRLCGFPSPSPAADPYWTLCRLSRCLPLSLSFPACLPCAFLLCCLACATSPGVCCLPCLLCCEGGTACRACLPSQAAGHGKRSVTD